MAKKVVKRQTYEQQLLSKWWVRSLLAMTFLLIAYGFASLAIDSGAWLAYGLGFFFIGWAIVQIKRAILSLRSN
jgi:hypothetical protein